KVLKEKMMKSLRLLTLAGVTLLVATTLAACSGSGSIAKGEKTFLYIRLPAKQNGSLSTVVG
ncbi:TPA: hypothetical protein ACQXUM_002108, partial [Streptococcus pneumoniae]